MQGQCVVFSAGDLVKIVSKGGARFLFVSGEPLNEPVAWRGPIVMVLQSQQSFRRTRIRDIYQNNKFIESKTKN